MELTSRSTIKAILRRHNCRPMKHLGQNFLIDKKVLQKIIRAADLSKNDVVLEVGPGLGALTKELAKRVKKVMAVEKDEKMVEILKKVAGDVENIKIIKGDILKMDSEQEDKNFLLRNSLAPQDYNYKIVANIPYYLTSPLIRLFLESKNPPAQMILLIQKEVAQRICAKPPKMSLLAVSVQFYAQPKIISYVSKKAFWPQPKVDSAIIKIANIHKFTAKNTGKRMKFFKLVKAGFSAPRKQLINNLSRELKIDKEQAKKALTDCGLNEKARPGDLTVEDWLKLAKVINH